MLSFSNNLILKNTGILFLRQIITIAFGLFSSRFILRGLGISDYGLYNVVGGIVVVMAFLNTIMTSTTYRFIAIAVGKKDNVEANAIFNVSLVIHIALALLLLVLTETAGVYYTKNYLNIEPEKINNALFVLRFSTYSSLFNILSLPFQGLLTAQEKFYVQASIEIFRSFSVLLISVFILNFSGNRIIAYTLLLAISSIISSIGYYLYSIRKYYEIVRWSFQRSIIKYREMIVFSCWIMIGAAASLGQNTGLNLIINVFYGTILNAAYGIANQINNLIRVFSRNLAQAAIPQIMKSYSSGDTERSVRLTAYTSKYAWLLLSIPSLPILLETEFIFKIWLGVFPKEAVLFSQLMIVNTLIVGLGNGLDSIVKATGKIKVFQIILSGTSILVLPISYIALNSGYPAHYVLVILIFFSSINVVVWQILLKKIIKFDNVFFLKTSYLKIFYVIVALIPIFIIKDQFTSNIWRFFLSTIFGLIWLIISIYNFALDHREKTLLKNILFNIISYSKKKNHLHNS